MSIEEAINGHEEAYARAGAMLPDERKPDKLTDTERLELKVLMLERQLIEQKIKGYLEVAIARRGLADLGYEINYTSGEIKVS